MNSLHKHRHALWQQITNISFLLPFFFVLTSVVVALSVLVPVQAATSDTLNFQGRLLTNTGGLVPDGTYNVEFNLYNVASGGSTLWTEDRLNTNTQGVSVRNGYFSVYLGEYDAFGAINWDQELWLGMTIRGTSNCAWGSCTPTDSEMTPRFKLSAVPYAFRASNVASSSTNAASTDSNDVSISSGNALGATSNSGDVNVDVGTATGITGQLLFGTSNASALTFGNSTTNPSFTFQGTGIFTIGSLDCSGNTNSGKLTANASGVLSCADDIGGTASATSINTLSGALTLQGTANEIEVTDNTTDTITIGLPDDVTIGSDLIVTDTLTVNSTSTFNGNVTVSAGNTLRLVGDSTVNRPAGTVGELYYDTDTDTLLTYNGTKWIADRGEYIIVAANDSTQAEKDSADYVADGNTGTANDGDQVEINAALTASNGGKVVLLAGTFVLDASISVPNNTTLSGMGEGTLIELGNLGTFDQAIVNTDTSTGTGMVIENLSLDGRRDLNFSVDGIYLQGVGGGASPNIRKGAIIRSVTFHDFNNGLVLYSSHHTTVLGNTFDRNSDAIQPFSATEYNVINSNKFIDNGNGISSSFDFNFNSISDNVAVSNGYFLDLGTGTGNTIDGNSIEGDSGTSHNIRLFGNSTVSNTITNNQITGGSTGIANQAGNAVISGNRISNTLDYGIELIDNVNSVVSGNTITNSGDTTDNNAIIVFGNSDNTIITSNNIADGSCTTTCYAINITFANSDNTYLADNLLGGGTIRDIGTNTIYGGQLDSTGNYDIQSTGTIELLSNTNVTGSFSVSGLATFNGGLTIEAGDTFTFNNDAFTDLTGTGLQVNAGSLETTLGTSIETAEITDSNVTNSKLANSQLAVNTGSGLTGGGNISLGGSRTLSLSDLTADWVQAGGYDIVLDNAGSELRIREASGIFYGEIDITDLSADRLYTFPDVDGDVTVLGQTIDNGELANSSVTVTAGTGLNGGGLVALGGSVTLNSDLGTSVDGTEIDNATIEAIDLEVTGAPTDGYILTYDLASGGFTWIDPAAAGVTLSEAEVEDFIFDGDNGVKVLSSGTLALGSLSYTGVLTDTNVSDTLTIGASSTVDDGALSANVSLLGSSIALGTETTGNYVATITTGSGLQGGTSGVGSTPNLALGNLTANWNQTAAFDIILDNSASQLQIKDDSDTYYGTFNVGVLGADTAYTFVEGGTVLSTGNIASNATTGVTAGSGLVGGGTTGLLSLDIGAGVGLTVNADDIEVNYGASSGTAVQGDTTITINGGTGLSGGGLLTLGAGGTLTINSDLGATIETGEITNDTILAADLDNTVAPGAPEDTYVATYDNATGGFTWVSQASIAGAGGVTSLNSLTGALNIVGNSQISVSPSGSDVNLSISAGSIGATQLASTAVIASSYGSASQVATFTVDADGRLTTAGNTAIAIDASAITSGTLPVNRGGTGAATLTSGGVLLGNGTGAIQNTGVLTNGQLLIGDGTGAPSVATLTQGLGITVTNGAGSITIASTLGTTVDGTEIINGTIEAVDLESTNVAGAGTDNYLVSYDNATGGFTYIDGSTVGTTLSEAQVEAYIFDADNSGTLSSGTLALNSLSYTGNLNVAQGGTGLTAAGAAGGIYYSTGTAFANNGAGTAGQCLLSNGAGAPTWGNCGGSGAGAVTLQVAYNQGNIITTTDNRNIGFTLANTTTDSDFIVNIATSSTSQIAFQSNSTNLFLVDSGGIDLLDVDVANFTGATVTFDAGEIVETEIAQNTLDDSEIQDNSLSAASLATDSVGADEIAADAVGASEIATDGVGASEIAANAVGASELASTTVGSGSYGSASTVATFTVDADGRLTVAGNTAINATLGTNTSGNYVESISATALGGLTVTGGTGEGSTPTIALDRTQTLAANPGLSANQVIFGTTGLLFEGATADTNEILLTADNATADRSITLPNASGTVAVSATGNIALNTSGQISFTGTLPVSSGGTGAITLAAGVLLGNGTGAITSTGTLSNGQLLIGDGSGAPTAATLTQSTGITITNGAGTITIASTLGTNIDSGEIVNNTVQEIDLEVTNTPTDNFVLTYDSATGGFTWVDPGTLGTTLDEATVESYIFDADNSGTLSSGTLALNSLSYTGDINDAQIADNITISASGTVNGGALTAGTVANGALANSSITVGTGSGLTGGGLVSLGGSLSLSLSALTSDWNQTGAFDVVLNNAASELRILESAGATYYGTFDVADLSSNQTYTFNEGGNVITTGNVATYATTGVTAGSGLTGGGTNGLLSLNVGAGTGVLVNANDIEVVYGSTAGTSVQGNTQITVTAGTGISGGGSITLGSGGSVTVNATLGTNIVSGEIVDNTIQEVDLEVTNAPTDNYLLSYDTATGGFTWVNPSGVGVDETTVEAYIFDADNTGTLSSGTLALNSLGYTGTLSVGYGGTGLSAAGTAGTIFFSNGTSFANTAQGTSGQCLLSAGAGTPSWGSCGGAGAGATTLQVAYGNGNQIDTTDNRSIIFNLADTTTDSGFIIDLQGAGSLFDVQDSTASKLTVNGAGNVGINDATPSYQLDVAGTGRFTNDLLVDGNVDLGNATTDTITFNGYVDSSILPDTDDTYDLGSSSLRWRDLYLGPNSLNIGTDLNNGTLSYNTTNSEFSFNTDVNVTGNLGVGVNNPAYTLDVNGTGYISGDTTVGGSLVLGDVSTASRITSTSDGGYGVFVDSDNNAVDTERAFEVRSNTGSFTGGSINLRVLQSGDTSIGGNLTVSGTGTSVFAGVVDAPQVTIDGVIINGTDGRNYFKDSELSTGNGLRVGAAWGMYGVYAESGNAVIGGAGGTVNIQNGAATISSGAAAFTGNVTAPRYYIDATRYLDYPTGSYGSIQINGGGAGGWQGFSIDGRAVFMHNGTTNAGLYNDVNNQWILYSTFGGNTDIRANGTARITATASGATINGTASATDFSCSNCINAGDLAANSVDSSEIAANSVGASEIDEAAIITAAEFRYTGYGWGIRNSADTDTGIYHASDGYISLYRNNVAGITLDAATDKVFIRVNGGTSATGVCRDGLGGIMTCSGSSQRYKNSISNSVYGLNELRQLRPVQYLYNEGYTDDPNLLIRQHGFIAEEVAQIDEAFIIRNPDGTVETVRYELLTSLLAAGVKELDLNVQSNTSEVASMKTRLSVLESTTTSLTKKNITVTDTVLAGRLKVTGTTELSSLKVTGITEVADLKINGKIITAGNAPTAVLGATTTGQGATYTLEGNDTAGSISITSGTGTLANPLAAGSQVDITFADAFDTIPRVTLTPTNDKSANVNYFVIKSVTGFSIHFTDVPIANTKYSFDYQILQ